MQRFLAYGPLPVRAQVRASRSLEERSVFDVQQRQAEVGSALFYEKLEPLSIKDHGHLGVSLTANPYAFLAETHAVPITADEFQYAAVCYPIVFTRKAIEACQVFENLARRTRDLIAVLERYDLFEDRQLSVPRANSDGTEASPAKIDDCLTISERKLGELPAEDYLKLRDMGIPGIAYAQLLSLRLWPKLLSRVARMHAAMRS